jgi:hypothetical protein
MGALETESIGDRSTGCRKLITAAVGKLEGRTGVGAGARYIPLIAYSDLFREGQRQRPTAQRSSAGISDTHIHLEVSP